MTAALTRPLAAPAAPVAVPPPPAAPPRLLMTREEFEIADCCPGTRVEWLGVSDETRGGEPLGLVWPRFGFNPDGSYSMANGTHGEIVSNVFGNLFTQIDRDAWQLLTQDGEVGCPTGRHRFPDVVLTPRPPRYADHPLGRRLVLLNPAICVEVLSEGTATVDLRDKPGDYLSVPTVTDYLVVAQTEPCVLHHRRVSDQPDRWSVTRVTDTAGSVEVAAPAVTLPLAEIYARVSFEGV